MEPRLSMHYFQVKKEIFWILLLSPLILLIIFGGIANNRADGQLTQKQYYETVVKRTVNLVFYTKSCPYCRVAKKEIITEAKDSHITTYYVDANTKEGQKLVQVYHVKYAPTIVSIRKGRVQAFLYARDRGNTIIVEKERIEKVFKN
ncbi:thioredoxin family protein [Streptococcus dysgalactiae]|uniref:Glutaredoxin-like protein n=1 Tax=Streptococcus dysgalactiae TaxID=1334 RepID=A0A9X9QSC4_STRDY|nr:thioredoxin family protein [Streptococcus dysgalactiae]VTS22085.1 Glutaredoxin-like protein [Streptococcus dysgalactiae subsp. equisimilis]VTS42512.1 Glutaredoxin-like protein [Streptococcus dysgalactiae subsp. equisimilis]VTS87730.1 Glutaredoxin-like protein [Streptococcus dysgalactiae]